LVTSLGVENQQKKGVRGLLDFLTHKKKLMGGQVVPAAKVADPVEAIKEGDPLLNSNARYLAYAARAKLIFIKGLSANVRCMILFYFCLLRLHTFKDRQATKTKIKILPC
jgi:hypothetical protein